MPKNKRNKRKAAKYYKAFGLRIQKRRMILLIVLTLVTFVSAAARHMIPAHVSVFVGSALVDYIFTSACSLLSILALEY